MHSLIGSLALLVLLQGETVAAWAAPPETPALSAAQRTIRRTIDEQIAAFRDDRANDAWDLVAPGLQAQFGTPERFLRMVRERYRPVYRPRAYTFGPTQPLKAGELGQWLDVVGPDGESVRALYLMRQLPDGTWRTNGCLLFRDAERPRA